MKKLRRLPALACALALVCALVLPAAGSSGSVPIYLLAANDKFCDLGGIQPLSSGGVIYIPYSTFDRNMTGVDLGVYYGITPERGTVLTLYALSGMLTFYVHQIRCEDNQGNVMNFHAILRNGIPYVPAAEVCRFFGLQYSYLPTADRGICIRITSPTSPHLDDNSFLTSARGAMTTRYQQILQSMSPQPDLPTVSTPPTSPVTSRPPDVSTGDVRVYLCLNASAFQGDVTSLFPAGVYALLLYTPDSLASQASQVRRAVAAGHSVGLLLDGTLGSEDALRDLERGNALLGHIARIRTRIVSVSGSASPLREELEREGWAVWTPSHTSALTSSTVRSVLGSRPSTVRLDLTATAASSMSRVISTLRSEGYNLRRPLESNL